MSIHYEVVERPERTNAGQLRRPFIEQYLLPTANTGQALRIEASELDTDPVTAMKRLRVLFAQLGYGNQYRLHIRADDEYLTMSVSWRI